MNCISVSQPDSQHYSSLPGAAEAREALAGPVELVAAAAVGAVALLGAACAERAEGTGELAGGPSPAGGAAAHARERVALAAVHAHAVLHAVGPEQPLGAH